MPELALIGHVVDGKDRGDFFVTGVAGVKDFQIGRYEAGLPVVGVQHVYRQVQQANGFQNGAGEKNEPFAIIDVILAVGPIQLVAVEILILLDEVDGHLAAGHGAAGEMAADHLAAHRDNKIESQPLGRLAAVGRLPVVRHDHRDLMAELGQFARQGAADIGQTAGLGEWNRFTGGQKDVHAWNLPWEAEATYCRSVNSSIIYAPKSML